MWTESRLVSAEAEGTVTQPDLEFIRDRVGWMLRADEDFEEFWRVCREHPLLHHCADLKAGALIRSASIFEDVVKTRLTTNCHWRNTKRMVAGLCREFGDEGAFPTPERLARAGEDELRSIGLGYRARFVSEFARKAVDGEISTESWIGRETDDLREELLSLPGIGPYSANHMLMLLGHYDRIPCDSEVCSYLGLPPGTDSRKVERLAAERYGAFGKYAFLAYKFERVLKNRNYVDAP
jgi:3-methyladenine DNA glycosylase/8-oxoguanine DNA glycosylase